MSGLILALLHKAFISRQTFARLTGLPDLLCLLAAYRSSFALFFYYKNHTSLSLQATSTVPFLLFNRDEFQLADTDIFTANCFQDRILISVLISSFKLKQATAFQPSPVILSYSVLFGFTPTVDRESLIILYVPSSSLPPITPSFSVMLVFAAFSSSLREEELPPQAVKHITAITAAGKTAAADKIFYVMINIF